MIRVAAIGEAMVELARAGAARSLALGYAGDTLNWAVYLAREGGGAVAVDYVTRLGRDPFSEDLAAVIADEGLGTGLIGRSATRNVGLYAIATDAGGERSFTYWRETSAARELFDDAPPALDDLAGYDVLLFSAITLAILTPGARARLFDWLAGFRARGGRVAFDSNHRPRLWPDAATARAACARAWSLTDFALPSLDDECALWGDGGDGAEAAVLDRLRGWGVRDGALKRGACGPVSLGASVPEAAYPPADRVVDTTAAGDAFNGAYLAARLTGRSQAEALAAGHALAVRVIAHPGALLPRAAEGDRQSPAEAPS